MKMIEEFKECRHGNYCMISRLYIFQARMWMHAKNHDNFSYTLQNIYKFENASSLSEAMLWMQWRIWCASSGNIWAYSIAQNCEWMIKVISPSFNHVLNESNFHISLFILKMIEKIIFFEKFFRFSLVLYSCCECGGQSKISHTFVNVFYFGVGFYGSSLKRDEFQSILYSFGHIRWTHYCLTHTHTMYVWKEWDRFIQLL